MISINYLSGQTIPQVNVAGRLDSINSSEFDQAMQPLLEEGRFIIIDLSRCTYLSSAGIRVLLLSHKKTLALGGGLFLAGLLPEVYNVLEMAGLHQVFRLYDSVDTAQFGIEQIQLKNQVSQEWSVGNHSFRFYPSDGGKSTAYVWTNQGIAGYNELEVSIGTGSAAETPEELEQGQGFFITCCNCAGFIPNDITLSSDFRIPKNPANAGIFVDQALSLGNHPAGVVRVKEPASLTFNQLSDALYQLRFNLSGRHSDLMAFVIADFKPASPSICLCLVVDRELVNALKQSGLHEIPGLLQASEPGIRLWGAKFVLESIPDAPADLTLSKFLGDVLTIENVLNVEFVHPDDLTDNPVSWIFIADKLADAAVKRLRLETDGDFQLKLSDAFLARRLYTDSARLEIKQLHGGYSAQTFHVTSYDHKLRKLRPTVLKIANRALITRESERCQRYAQPYILNNSAQVLGTEFFGNTGALRYNFVGIGGQHSQLKWLTHYFLNWTTDQLKPLFDKIFLQILNPWYGQPIRETIYPYRDHDPRLTFFPGLCEAAAELFSVSCDEQYVTLEETGQKLINPYWFLKHEFKNRRETGINYFTSICHGDLNMQNILLDEDMNVYLIDFSETKPRSLISDFARLEAIFMVEHAVMTNLSEIEAYVQFLTRFYSSIDLREPPAYCYVGANGDSIARNIALTVKMREYAVHAVGEDPNPVPYCLAMLEWVLPVVCYTAPASSKRYSMIVAGLLCEAVMRCDANRCEQV